MSTEPYSPFAQALRALLTADPETPLMFWVEWLNPWYAERDDDGNLTGARIMPLGGDFFAEEPSPEERRAAREEFERHWVPCHQVGQGVTLAMVEGWLRDESMPSVDQLNQIVGHVLQFQMRDPKVQEAMAAFSKVLTVHAGNVTPHGWNYVFQPFNFGTIGARLVMERYGVIRGLLHLPPERWEKVFDEVARSLHEDK